MLGKLQQLVIALFHNSFGNVVLTLLIYFLALRHKVENSPKALVWLSKATPESLPISPPVKVLSIN